MSSHPHNDAKGAYKSVFIAYFILVLHVVLIAGLGLLVLFFRGFVNYMVWIFLGGSVFILASGYLFYRRMRKEGRTLQEMINLPAFRGRSVEVSVLGGLVSLKINRSTSVPLLDSKVVEPEFRLEHTDHDQYSSTHPDIKELAELVRLLESGLITSDEYHKAKRQIFK